MHASRFDAAGAPHVELPLLMARRRDGQDAWEGYGAAWSIIGTLLAGLAVWGGIGFFVDRLADTHDVFLAIGLVVGAVGGVYIVVVRYGRERKD
jgi:ATP synthase protein I